MTRGLEAKLEHISSCQSEARKQFVLSAVGPQGEHHRFLLTAKRMRRQQTWFSTFKTFHFSSGVITVDKNPAYPKAIKGQDT